MKPINVRKKPVTVQVMFLTRDNAHEVADWCGGRVVEKGKASDPSDVYIGLDIPTLEGVMRAETMDSSGRFDYGSVIIRGVHGEFYRCDPAIFAETYEVAEALGIEQQ